MLLSCQTLDVLYAFYIFSKTNLLTQCQVPVPVFSMFLTPFGGDFETESKRNKISEKIFSVTEEDQKTWEPRQGGPGAPQAPTPRPGGRPRPTGLWAPWTSFALSFAHIYPQKFHKKSGDHRKYFSAAASFCLRKIPSGARTGALPAVGFRYGGLLHQHHDLSDDAWVVHHRPSGP